MFPLLLWTLLLPDLQGKLHDPFAGFAKARVFLFARSDCPITNRYAPEWSHIVTEFENRGVRFTVVYPGRSVTPNEVSAHIREFRIEGDVLLDPDRILVKRAAATTAPEVTVFGAQNEELYRGRIDDRYLSIGRSRPGGARVHDLEVAIRETLAGRRPFRAVTPAVGCSLADVQ